MAAQGSKMRAPRSDAALVSYLLPRVSRHMMRCFTRRVRCELYTRLQRASAAHAGGDDELVFGVHVDQGVEVSEVRGRVLIGRLEAAMVVLDHRVEQVGEQRVRFGIGGVQADATVEVLHAWDAGKARISMTLPRHPLD